MAHEEPTSLAAFFAAWALFREPSLAGVFAGAILGLLGVYVVLRRMVFLTASLSQVAGLGVAIAFYLRIHHGVGAALASPTIGAAVTTFASLVPFVSRANTRRESALGVIYLVGAAGTLALGTRIAQDLHDIEALLFGSAVAIVPEDFWLLAGVSAGLLFLHAWWWRGFSAVSFDPVGAAVRGLPVRALDVALMGSLGLAVSISTRVLGALPTFAFTVLPALAAIRVASSLPVALFVSAGIGMFAGFAGYLLAFVAQLPVGASQTLVAAGVVLLVRFGAALGGRAIFRPAPGADRPET